MNSGFVAQLVHSVNDRRFARSPLQTDRTGREVAFAVTKEAFWMVVLLSSLALWTAIWTAAASLASAWLQ